MDEDVDQTGLFKSRECVCVCVSSPCLHLLPFHQLSSSSFLGVYSYNHINNCIYCSCVQHEEGYKLLYEGCELGVVKLDGVVDEEFPVYVSSSSFITLASQTLTLNKDGAAFPLPPNAQTSLFTSVVWTDHNSSF